MNGDVDWKTFRHWEREPNILERDYQLKRAMGFPEATFTRIGRIIETRLKALQSMITLAISLQPSAFLKKNRANQSGDD
jgi:hypothetical protein